MNELQKLESFRYSLAVSETIEEIKLCKTAAEFYLKIQKDKDIGKSAKDEIGQYLIECEIKEAEWLDDNFPHGNKPGENKRDVRLPSDTLQKMPVSKKESARVRKIKEFKEKYPRVLKEIEDKIRNSKDIELSPKSIYKEITNYLKEKEKEKKKKEREKIKIEEKKNIETRDGKPGGGWYKVGNQFLYFGSNLDDEFIKKLPQSKLAFADPPYNANVDTWDNDFTWKQDYLERFADVVAITPGGWNAFNFYNQTQMNYLWEMCCWIKNGMTHGKCGYANFIKISLFGKRIKIPQDFFFITIKTGQTEDTLHRGRKPYDFMIHIIDLFTVKGDTIIDPFAGSGTTLLVSEQMNRISYNAEINEDFFIEILTRAKSNKMSYERI